MSSRPQPAISAGAAIAVWVLAWSLGQVLVAAVVLSALDADADDLTTPQTLAAMVVGWVVMMAGLWFASKNFGTGDPEADLGVRFRPVDLLGLPAGALLQLLVVPAVYWPLEQLWPGPFDPGEVEARATELVDKADGGWLWLLALGVVLAAPLVEELMYRGLLQRSFGARIGRVAGWLAVSLGFALIHFSPVEIPGLLMAGLVFGAGVLATGRIGWGLAAHVGFNAAGMAVVLWF